MDNKTLDIFEAMNELYESVQNNLILIANKQLFKNLKSKNWKDIQLSKQSIKELKELLNTKAKELLEQCKDRADGNYAYTCEKCATVFGYYGDLEYQKILENRSRSINERA